MPAAHTARRFPISRGELMSNLLHMAADACPGTPYARTTVTNDEVIAIPAANRGKFWWFRAVTSAVAIRFGTADTVAVSITDRSTGTPPAITAGTTEPHIYLEPGEMV